MSHNRKSRAAYFSIALSTDVMDEFQCITDLAPVSHVVTTIRVVRQLVQRRFVDCLTIGSSPRSPIEYKLNHPAEHYYFTNQNILIKY